MFPYRTVGFSDLLLYDLKVDFNNVRYHPEWFPNWTDGDISLMAAIIHFTPRPLYIQQVATHITTELFGGKDEQYIAMHWRYDELDWARHCQLEKIPKRIHHCNSVLSHLRTPAKIARKLIKWIKKIKENGNESKGLYIAAPLSSKDLVDAIKHQVSKDIPNFIVATSSESMPIFHDLLYDCDYIKDNNHDVFSQIDMEICSNSRLFMRSMGSSWSNNVHQERKVHGTDREDVENMSILEMESFDEFEQ